MVSRAQEYEITITSVSLVRKTGSNWQRSSTPATAVRASPNVTPANGPLFLSRSDMVLLLMSICTSHSTIHSKQSFAVNARANSRHTDRCSHASKQFIVATAARNSALATPSWAAISSKTKPV